jgi:hypothetical protein
MRAYGHGRHRAIMAVPNGMAWPRMTFIFVRRGSQWRIRSGTLGLDGFIHWFFRQGQVGGILLRAMGWGGFSLISRPTSPRSPTGHRKSEATACHRVRRPRQVLEISIENYYIVPNDSVHFHTRPRWPSGLDSSLAVRVAMRWLCHYAPVRLSERTRWTFGAKQVLVCERDVLYL